MPSSSARLLWPALCLAYSLALFFIASRLPVLTKQAAAALTWVVYVQLVKLAVLFTVNLLLFVVFIRWSWLPRRWAFLLLCLAWAVPAAYLLRGLGDSVNEYAHLPQYALLVLLWYRALRELPSTVSHRAWSIALAVSALLGVLEESFQRLVPGRRFDPQDILLNLLGVGLGGLLLWVLAAPQPITADVAAREKPCPPASFIA